MQMCDGYLYSTNQDLTRFSTYLVCEKAITNLPFLGLTKSQEL